MTKVRACAVMLGLILLSVSWHSSAVAQLTKLNVGYSAISGDQLPAWVAKEAGIFQKNGLDVQMIYFTGGITAVMALVSADTPISQVAGSAVVNSALAGSDLTLIVGGVTSLNYYLMAQPRSRLPSSSRGARWRLAASVPRRISLPALPYRKSA